MVGATCMRMQTETQQPEGLQIGETAEFRIQIIPLTPWKTSRAHLQPAIYFSHTEYLKFSRLACSVFAWNDFCMTDDWKSA